MHCFIGRQKLLSFGGKAYCNKNKQKNKQKENKQKKQPVVPAVLTVFYSKQLVNFPNHCLQYNPTTAMRTESMNEIP